MWPLIGHNRLRKQLRECPNDHVRVVHAQAFARHARKLAELPSKLTNRLLDRLLDFWVMAQRNESLKSADDSTPDRCVRPC